MSTFCCRHHASCSVPLHSPAPTIPPPDQALKLGTCRLEDYEVGRVLGTGSFGRVSLARHKASGAVCAIKALSKAHVVKNQQAGTGFLPGAVVTVP